MDISPLVADVDYPNLPGFNAQGPSEWLWAGNENLSPFVHRLARVHANCIQGLPIFGGTVAVATMLKTDRLALWFLDTRLV